MIFQAWNQIIKFHAFPDFPGKVRILYNKEFQSLHDGVSVGRQSGRGAAQDLPWWEGLALGNGDIVLGQMLA